MRLFLSHGRVWRLHPAHHAMQISSPLAWTHPRPVRRRGVVSDLRFSLRFVKPRTRNVYSLQTHFADGALVRMLLCVWVCGCGVCVCVFFSSSGNALRAVLAWSNSCCAQICFVFFALKREAAGKYVWENGGCSEEYYSSLF